MSLHELNKQRNRDRILTAADQIIREQGLEHLSMRYLAEFAGVSLRTPYNLFGSKTVILGELLMRTLAELILPIPLTPRDGPRPAVLRLLEGLQAARPKLDEHVRSLYWAIMTAPEQELRDRGIAQLTALIQPLTEQAVQLGQLRPDCDTPRVTRHLVITLLAIIGMWGGGQLSIDEALDHIEQAWLATLGQQAAR